MATNDEAKIYPGSIDRYRELRRLREQFEEGGSEGGERHPLFAAAVIAEELAGLAYILDGIRYSARKM